MNQDELSKVDTKVAVTAALVALVSMVATTVVTTIATKESLYAIGRGISGMLSKS